MRNVRIAKVLFYPIAGVIQLFVVPNIFIGAVLCLALIGLAALNLKRLTEEG